MINKARIVITNLIHDVDDLTYLVDCERRYQKVENNTDKYKDYEKCIDQLNVILKDVHKFKDHLEMVYKEGKK